MSAALDESYRALGSPHRRALLRLIGDGERTVADLAAGTDLRQPTASQHLKVLRDAGLVAVRVDGNRRLYSVDFERLAAVRASLDSFWRTSLGSLKAVAESEARR